MTCPHHVTTTILPAAKPAPSSTTSSTGAPHEPVAVKPEMTTMHVMGAYTDWLTLGLPANIWVPLPTKLPGNRSQHSCLICADIK